MYGFSQCVFQYLLATHCWNWQYRYISVQFLKEKNGGACYVSLYLNHGWYSTRWICKELLYGELNGTGCRNRCHDQKRAWASEVCSLAVLSDSPDAPELWSNSQQRSNSCMQLSNPALIHFKTNMRYAGGCFDANMADNRLCVRLLTHWSTTQIVTECFSTL